MRSAPPGAKLPSAPSARQVTGWLTRHPESLPDDVTLFLKQLFMRCPELNATAECVRDFAKMFTRLDGQRLPQWIDAAEASAPPPMRRFAIQLRSDVEAVTRGLTMSWNSGPIEGRFCDIKAIKRQMFGRASFPLPRKRVLLVAASRRMKPTP
ncbi:transposase [Streptomyces sp. WM6378]|uniref:transposase n=1 Tax=Streptomyces sp. WM6378 TaxID=1415557 RepID=UPI0022772757|nr:transposase [Streptomyces sp. WM6378]